jgi:nucleoside-diphosphate-sugar epimerase
LGTTHILDAALAAGVKKLVITASIVSLVALPDFWKEINITEKCKSLIRSKTTRKKG